MQMIPRVDDDGDAAANAVLAKSFKDPTVCGHVSPMEHVMVLVVGGGSTTTAASSIVGACCCPICDAPFAYIEDSAVKDGGPTVYFKYGKMVFRLSVLLGRAAEKKVQQQLLQQQQQRPWWRVWQSSSSNNYSSSSSNAASSSTTAQQRIMSVLGISHGMKVCTVSKPLLLLLRALQRKLFYSSVITSSLKQLSISLFL